MKKWFTMKKWIVTLLVLVASCFLFAACDDASSKVLMTLNAGDGGTIVGNDSPVRTVEAAEGQSVAELLGGVEVAANEGFTFDGWYIGDKKVGDQTVPKAGLVVTAKYLVGYTVNVYKQAEDGTYGAPEAVKAQGTYGEPFEYVPDEAHFSVDQTRFNRLSTDSLTAGDEFAVFLQRETCGITYHNITSDGEEESVSVPEVLYGSHHTVMANPFEAEIGRRFAGWTKEEGGAADSKYTPDTEIAVDGTLDLYAVWDEAYTDRMGGGDHIYLPQLQSGTAILDRNGVEFTGTVADGVFTVEYQGAKLKGKVNETSDVKTFMYENMMEKGKYVYYDRYYDETKDKAARINDKVTLTLNEYGEGVLEDGDDSYSGVCFYDPLLGDYVFAIDEIRSLYFTYGKEESDLFFTLQGMEYGSYGEFISAAGFLVGYPGDGLLTLDGYGEAVWRDTYHREDYEGYYSINTEKSGMSQNGEVVVYCIDLHIYATDGWLFGDSPRDTWVDRTVYCIDLDGTILYVYEDLSAKGEYIGEGGLLKLDGYGGFSDSAVFGSKSGTYFSYDSDIFGTVVEVTCSDGSVLCFQLKDDGTGKTCKQFDGKITEMVNLHMGQYENDPLFEEPILVMYAEKKGRIPAEVYVEVNGDYTLVLTGHCTSVKQGDYTVYTFTSDQVNDPDHKPFEKIVFLAEDLFTKNEILVHAYYIFEKDDSADYTLYTGEEANAGEKIWSVTLAYNGVGAFYQTKDGTVYAGSFSVVKESDWFDSTQKYGIFRYAGEDDEWAYFYFEIKDDGSSRKFSAIDYLPYLLTSTDDTYNYWFENFVIDPEGNAQFQVQDEWENEVGVVKGTYTAVGKTICGDVIYRFDPEENEYEIESFEFVIENDYVYNYSGTKMNMDVYHEKVTDPEVKFEFELEGGGTLKGDGFWFKGQYDGPLGQFDGLMYNGRDEEHGKIMIFESEEYSLIFDILSDGKLSMRDGADGYYKLLNENSENVNKWYLELDGHGNLMVFDDGAYRYIYNGTYTEIDYGIYQITIDMGNSIVIEMEVALISGSSNAAVIVDRAGRGLYLAGDLSMLYFDGMNVDQCYYIDPLGIGHIGDYFLFDEFGVFNYSDGSEVITFTYDKVKKTYEKLDQSAYYGLYYSNDLMSAYNFGKIVTFGENAGYYIVTEGSAEGEKTFTMYLFSENSSDISKKTATLKDGVLTVGSDVFTNVSGQKLSLTGTATLSGATQLEGLTLEFTPGASMEEETDVTINGKGDMHAKISGRYLWLYVNGEMLELDIDLKNHSFTIVCESDNELAALKSALGLTE